VRLFVDTVALIETTDYRLLFSFHSSSSLYSAHEIKEN